MTDRWYVFGFCENRPEALPSGPLGEPTTVELDGVDGWAIVAPVDPSTGSWSDAPPEQLTAAAVHHDDVLAAAVACNVVPARFGGTVPSLGAAAGLGSLQGEHIRRVFDRCRGRAEYDVRLLVGRTPVSGSGRDYLTRRRDELAGRGDLAEMIERVETIADEVRVRSRSRQSVRLAVLATDEQVQRLRDVLAPGGVPDVRGPLAPYSFADEVEEPHDAAV